METHETILDPMNDQQLIASFKAGDEKAFRNVYDMLHQRLYFFALRFVETADAEDAASEAFISLWNKRANFEHMAAVRHYLFLTVRNRCFNILQHGMVKLQKQADLLQQLESSGNEDLELEQLKTGLVRHIYAEAEKLPEKMRAIFLMSFAQGLKPADIASRLGISVQTVSNQKLTAIRLLKTALGNRSALLAMLILLHSEW